MHAAEVPKNAAQIVQENKIDREQKIRYIFICSYMCGHVYISYYTQVYKH
jgi:hypothetical protein